MLTTKVIFVFVSIAASTQGLFFKSKVCYGKYGCFFRQTGLNSALVALPAEPSAIGTKYFMFTRKGSWTVDDSNKGKLSATNFDISRRTILIIHGWRKYTESTNTWAHRIKNAVLRREDCNVILVDWSKGSQQPYRQSSGNIRLVGAQVGELIRFLISSTSGSRAWAKRFYIVGFSLGAQTAGYAGSYLKARAGMTLGRITGLDPAGPLFTGNDPKFRLDPTDAEYVDVIHTDMPSGGILTGLGTSQKAGHTDFFPNGGIAQPGCEGRSARVDLSKICDHTRAPEFFIASIQNQCSRNGYPCKNYSDFAKGWCKDCKGTCPSMGFDADKTKRWGSFYLKTGRKYPYCGLY